MTARTISSVRAERGTKMRCVLERVSGGLTVAASEIARTTRARKKKKEKEEKRRRREEEKKRQQDQTSQETLEIGLAKTNKKKKKQTNGFLCVR